ncbi:MAG: hypothetical protein AAF184_04485 [Pseudomonadota bacterium]
MTGSSRKPPLGDAEGPGAYDRQDSSPLRAWADEQYAVAIEDPAALSHTGYIELVPDHLRDRTCWNGAALYYTPPTFDLLSPLLDALDSYTPYSFLHYGTAVFEAFTARLETLAQNLQDAADDTQVDNYWFSLSAANVDQAFEADFNGTRKRLLDLTQTSARRLRAWRANSPEDGLHVLGL